MLTILIGLLYIFVAIMSVDKGEWGILAGATILLVILILMADGDRKDTKAWLNMRDYWASGGPRRETWVPEPERPAVTQRVTVNVVHAPEPEMGIPVRQSAQAVIRSDSEMSRLFGTGNSGMETFMCPICGRAVQTACKTIKSDRGVTKEYWCPNCRKTVRVSF